jgi:hypothetical protein
MDNGLRFLPSNVVLLRSYLFPRIRGEDKPNNPNDYIHSLPNDSLLSQSLNEILETYPIPKQHRVMLDKILFHIINTITPRRCRIPNILGLFSLSLS